MTSRLTSFSKEKIIVQYKAALVITGATKQSSSDKLCHELCLESLVDRKWSREGFFHKITQGL